MQRHLNTLYVTLDKSYLHKNGAAIEVSHNGETKLRVPFHNLDGIVCFGWDCCASAALMGACAEANVTLSFHTPHGKFLAASQGFTSGNILLRRAQYRFSDSPDASLEIARNIIAGKIANSRHVLLRAAREHSGKDINRCESLIKTTKHLLRGMQQVKKATDVEQLRGIEGEAASQYFSNFNCLLTNSQFTFSLRKRRPPTDPINALLSFLYSLLTHDCRSACESCGLDAQCGFLHAPLPGRPSLALDLMEEFRAIFADRTAITLINRKQIKANHFKTKENGAVYLKDEARKIVLNHWQERKQVEIIHPLLEEKTTFGLLPHIQARLLARHLRDDLDAYPPYLIK